MHATILKIGGRSLATPGCIDDVVDTTHECVEQGRRPILVVSAMGSPKGSGLPKVTDLPSSALLG